MGNYKYDDVEALQYRNNWKVGNSKYEFLDIEIDHICKPSSCGPGLSLCDGSEHDITLYKYHEVPNYLKGNPYVVEGYRSMLPFSFCVKR